MEKLGGFLGTFRKQVSGFWSSLSVIKKVAISAIVAVLLLSIVAVSAVSTKEDTEYLYLNLSDADTQSISAELKKMGVVEFTTDSKGIKVAPDQVMPLRIRLSEEGLPSHGQIGWEKFDEQDFTRTEFEQTINRRRAIEGELSRTISSIEGVMSARVHIVEPKKALFVEDKLEPTAAIYIKTKRGADLSQKQISGIIHLVSRSVEGLKPESVTLIDHNGKMLTKMETDDPTNKRSQEMLEYRRAVTKELEDKAQSVVARIVGPDKVAVKVDVDVDFTREETTTSDIDPDRVVVIASNTTNQELDGRGLNPTGIPGAKSNVPGEEEDVSAGSGSSSSSKRGSERLNYEVAKKQSHKILPYGNILRISAAVLVDGKQIQPPDGSPPIFEARPEEEMKKIEDLVRSSLGFKEGRDTVTVRNILFEPAEFQVEQIQTKKTENRNYISTLVVSSVSALAIVFFFSFVVRPYFRWLSYDPERKKAETKVEEFKPDLELGGIQNVQVKEDVPFEKLTPQEQILYLAKHEPKRTTEAIRLLLNPHSNIAGV